LFHLIRRKIDICRFAKSVTKHSLGFKVHHLRFITWGSSWSFSKIMPSDRSELLFAMNLENLRNELSNKWIICDEPDLENGQTWNNPWKLGKSSNESFLSNSEIFHNCLWKRPPGFQSTSPLLWECSFLSAPNVL
jgi:hypothetical protein